MMSSRVLRPMLLAALFSSCAWLVLPPAARAQQTPAAPEAQTAQGVALYEKGDDAAAVELLRQAVRERKGDLKAWHYLGLALGRQGQTDPARKAHEKAARLGEELLESLFTSVPYESVATSAGHYRALLEEAADSAEKYLALTPKPSSSKVEEWSGRAAALRDYVRLSEAGGGNQTHRVYKTSEVTTKARVLSRPEPQMTEEARQRRVNGVIVIRAIFAFDGKVRGIRVVKGLDYGLDEEAVRAARQIKFTPATIDGQPVSQYFQIEYSFSAF
jgi:TonB family protein